MIIPIIVSIIMLPILVIITICSIRFRNIRARQKRIKDWAKENKIPRSTDNSNDKVLILDISDSSLLPTKPVVRFMIPDPKLESIVEKTGVEEEDEATGDDTDFLDKDKSKRRNAKVKASHKRRIFRMRSRSYKKCFRRDESIRKDVVSRLMKYRKIVKF